MNVFLPIPSFVSLFFLFFFHPQGEAGCRVLITSRKETDLQTAVAQLHRQEITASYFAADCSSEIALKELATHAITELGGQVDILVNNAGAAWGAPAENHSLSAWDKVMALNVRGYFILSQCIAKQSMIPRRSGRIINMASIAGFGGNSAPELTTLAYNTSKGAVVNFTRALGCEWY